MVEQEVVYKKLIKIYPFAILIFVFLLIFSLTLYNIFYPVFIGTPKKIYISPGMKGSDIGWFLEREGIIRSSFYFRILMVLKKIKPKAGYYEFYGFNNILDVLTILEKGGKGIKITIPEGKTVKEIEEILKTKGFNLELSSKKLKDYASPIILKYFPPTVNLEGFLMPDTYEFYKEDNEKQILNKILANFEKKLLPEILKVDSLPPYETLILASIIEKEAKKENDFFVISGILLKRLANKMKLEADAPLVYEKCGFRFCDYELTKKDLNTTSPFNTYKNFGLPPQPISNPGILAIKAILNPLPTDYWFYLTDKEGNAYYAKTYKEHLENIKKYLKPQR
ncbi:Endolytic murein transglycosylase [bacterium HR35]|nr:Endolytic murein transglycosylase [bacterium HR35]